MSLQAMSSVFRVDLPPIQKLVLLIMADHADAFGCNSYPAVSTIAQKASMSERSVQRILRQMEKMGVLIAGGKHVEYRTVIYKINVTNLPERVKPEKNTCPNALRLEVIPAFQNTCQHCFKTGDSTNGPDGDSWHIDRIIPAEKGGNYSPENVTLSCGSCNRSMRFKKDQTAPKSFKETSEIKVPHMAPTSVPHNGTHEEGVSKESWVPSEVGVGATGGTSWVPLLSYNPKEEPINPIPSGESVVPPPPASVEKVSEVGEEKSGRKTSKKPRAPKPPKPEDPFRGQGNKFIQLWCEAYEAVLDECYPVARGVDHTAALLLVKKTNRSPEDLVKIAVQGWREFEVGYDRRMVLTIAMFNKCFIEVVDGLKNKPKSVGQKIALRAKIEEMEDKVVIFRANMEHSHNRTPKNFDRLETMEKELAALRKEME